MKLITVFNVYKWGYESGIMQTCQLIFGYIYHEMCKMCCSVTLPLIVSKFIFFVKLKGNTRIKRNYDIILKPFSTLKRHVTISKITNLHVFSWLNPRGALPFINFINLSMIFVFQKFITTILSSIKGLIRFTEWK